MDLERERVYTKNERYSKMWVLDQYRIDYIDTFAVDLILLFSWVHIPTMKLKIVKISFSNSHTSTSP